MFSKSIYSFLSQHWLGKMPLVASVIRAGAAARWCCCWGISEDEPGCREFTTPHFHKRRASKPSAKTRCATFSQGPTVSWVQVAKVLDPTSDIPKSSCGEVHRQVMIILSQRSHYKPAVVLSGWLLSPPCPALPGMWSAPHSPTGAPQLPEILLCCLTPAGYSALCSCSLSPPVGLGEIQESERERIHGLGCCQFNG